MIKHCVTGAKELPVLRIWNCGSAESTNGIRPTLHLGYFISSERELSERELGGTPYLCCPIEAVGCGRAILPAPRCLVYLAYVD